jgi:hypothetical protein
MNNECIISAVFQSIFGQQNNLCCDGASGGKKDRKLSYQRLLPPVPETPPSSFHIPAISAPHIPCNQSRWRTIGPARRKKERKKQCLPGHLSVCFFVSGREIKNRKSNKANSGVMLKNAEPE